jgi:3-hydroxyacyl-[acyl-carrier-protein] dehydratase
MTTSFEATLSIGPGICPRRGVTPERASRVRLHAWTSRLGVNPGPAAAPASAAVSDQRAASRDMAAPAGNRMVRQLSDVRHLGQMEIGSANSPENGMTPPASRRPEGQFLSVEQITEYLPHRYPFLLVDRIVEFEAGKSITGIKNVTANEPFFQGHFPGHPIMPGVFIVEAMAQVGGLLMVEEADPEEDPQIVYLASVDRVRWRRPVVPGDQLRISVRLLKARRNLFRVSAEATVEGEMAASAEITCQVAPASAS